jgi:hypothetical protein
MIVNETTERETLTRHYLCRVLDSKTGVPVWRVLCNECRNRSETGFKRISFSEFPCDLCGVKWMPPPGPKAIPCKDKAVTITAHYPDLETARNDIA